MTCLPIPWFLSLCWIMCCVPQVFPCQSFLLVVVLRVNRLNNLNRTMTGRTYAAIVERKERRSNGWAEVSCRTGWFCWKAIVKRGQIPRSSNFWHSNNEWTTIFSPFLRTRPSRCQNDRGPGPLPTPAMPLPFPPPPPPRPCTTTTIPFLFWLGEPTAKPRPHSPPRLTTANWSVVVVAT